jgi:hypothetical protein
MPYTCRVFRDRVLSHAGDTSAFELDLAQHVSTCTSCAAFAQRVSGQARALRGLAHRAAPDELAGLVVAACNAGHRQARAISALGKLSRWEVPAELDTKVLDESPELPIAERAKAPRVLERLVDEDLHDPPKAIARRFAGRLERLRAPGSLRSRVAGQPVVPLSTSEWTSAWTRARVLTLAGLAAAAVVLIAGGIYWSRAPRYSFDVVHETSLERFDPVVSSLLGGVTGGLSDAHPSAHPAAYPPAHPPAHPPIGEPR